MKQMETLQIIVDTIRHYTSLYFTKKKLIINLYIGRK